VALGRALVRRPGVFLFDEPLSNLDPQTSAQMRAELLSLRDRLATTALYVTHDQAEAMSIGHRLAVIRNGVLQQIGVAREIYQRPANVFVAGFIGSPRMNLLRGVVTEDAKGLSFRAGEASGNGAVTLRLSANTSEKMKPYLERQIVLGVRPENVSLEGTSVSQATPSMVEVVENAGPDQFVHARIGAEVMIARLPANRPIKVRDPVTLNIDMSSAHFFAADTGMAIA
jgi:multiple sugar transport system ATP-binding protein